jgi:hypothetical protein
VVERPMDYPTFELTIADTALPTLPDIADPEVQVWRENDGTVCAYGHTAGGVHWMHLPGLASFRFGDGMDAIVAIPHPPVREDLVFDAYRRSVLPMALQVRGHEVLHASAVLTPQGVVALCAVSGTGKSTTAFGLSRRGWPLWADDAVAFEASESGVAAIPLPFDIRLRSEAATFFDRDAALAGGTSERIGVRAQIEAEPVPLAALLVLDRIPGKSDTATVRIRQLSSTRAFLDVLAHAYCFSLRDAERKQIMMRHYLDLASRVPIFEVRFRPGLKTLSTVLDGIGELITTLGEAERTPMTAHGA